MGPRYDRLELAAIFGGGSVGAVARGLLSEAIVAKGAQWPWATFIVNLAGAALLGYCVTRLQERLPPSTYRRPLLATGFCGALTTFSTMQLELLRMLDGGDYRLAATYAVASVAGGYFVIFTALRLTRRVRIAG